MPDIAHWFHVYAGGDWETPVDEHLDALHRSGLAEALTTFRVGIVGPGDRRLAAIQRIGASGIPLRVVAEADEGWEQVTLAAMYEWAQHNDGLICYTHTKGASRNEPIDRLWRRDMELHNVIEWERIVEAFAAGHKVAGAHWITDPNSDHAGMFGGNFWWVDAALLRQGEPPKNDYRHRAEEWLGDLGRVTPLDESTVFDLCPTGIDEMKLHSDWP